MGQITIDQSHTVMGILATNTDWGSIDFADANLQDAIIRNPTGAGAAFTAWLKSGATTAAAATAPLPPPKKKATKTVLVLHDDNIVVGPLTKKFICRDCFKTRPGLYLWNDMERVLSATEDANPVEGIRTLASYDLTKNAYNREIEADLRKDHKKHEVELWQIAELIERQKNGEEGILLTNGYANIFNVAGFAVGVDWDSGRREWDVFVWVLGDDRWRRGSRVFSGN